MMKSYLGNCHALRTDVDANDFVTSVRKALHNIEVELHP